MRSNVFVIGAACVLMLAAGCSSGSSGDDDDDDIVDIDAATTIDAAVECTGPSDCDDGVACTDDTCVGNACVHTPNNGMCDDSVGCTVDTCDLTLGCQSVANDGMCDDSVGCTVDTCDETLGCQHVADDGLCDDSVGCTDDTCDAALDCQHVADDGLCDDSIDCTADTCDVALDCQHAPDDGLCDDGVGCTTNTCNPATGCEFPPDDLACDDTLDCTTDTCDPALDCLIAPNPTCFGQCSYVLIYNDCDGSCPPDPSAADEAVAAFGLPATYVTDAATFETELATGVYDVVVFESDLDCQPQTTLDAVTAYVTGGGLMIFSFWDLDGNSTCPHDVAALQTALGVSTGTDFTTPRDVYADPTAYANLFDGIQAFPSPLPQSNVWDDDGDELTLTAGGFLAARFDSEMGPGAIAVTNGGATIVNGFDFFGALTGTPVNGDADGLRDMEELYQNELQILCTEPRIYAADGNNTGGDSSVGGQPGNLYTIGVISGDVQTIGPIGVAITGLAFAPDGTLYAVASGAGDRDLLTIDPQTGAPTVIGSMGANILADITILADGTLIGWHEGPDQAASINKTTAVVTNLATDPGIFTAGSAIATNDADVTYFMGPNCTNLYTMDNATGALTSVTTLSGCLADSRPNSATFLSGRLLVADKTGFPATEVDLVEVDLVTGALTMIAPLPTGVDAIAAP